MNTLITLAAAASTPTQAVSPGWFTPVIVAVCVLVLGLTWLYVTNVYTKTSDRLIVGLSILLTVGGISFAIYAMVIAPTVAFTSSL